MKAVFFDLDGTLCDTLQDLCASLNYALRTFDYPARSLKEVRSMVGNGIPKLCERAMPAGSGMHFESVVSLLKAHYMKHCTDATLPYAGMAETVKALRSRGYKLAVITNKSQPVSRRIISELFPENGADFSLVLGQNDLYPLKPDPAVLYAAMDALSVSDVTYVGDSRVDAHFASNANIPFIGCGWGYDDPDNLAPYGTVIFQPEDLLTQIH